MAFVGRIVAIVCGLLGLAAVPLLRPSLDLHFGSSLAIAAESQVVFGFAVKWTPFRGRSMQIMYSESICARPELEAEAHRVSSRSWYGLDLWVTGFCVTSSVRTDYCSHLRDTVAPETAEQTPVVREEADESFCHLWIGSRGFVLAGALLLAFPLAYLLRGPVRRWRRRRRGLCIRCGYNLTGNVSGTCPECGLVCNPVNGDGP